jgi:hypothetical protein
MWRNNGSIVYPVVFCCLSPVLLLFPANQSTYHIFSCTFCFERYGDRVVCSFVPFYNLIERLISSVCVAEM